MHIFSVTGQSEIAILLLPAGCVYIYVYIYTYIIYMYINIRTYASLK